MAPVITVHGDLISSLHGHHEEWEQVPLPIEGLHGAVRTLHAHNFATSLGFLFVQQGMEKNNKKC